MPLKPVSTPKSCMHYQGLLYRALNPIWAREPLSGEGARRFGGRFNPKGVPALYTSLSIQTAIREANQIGTLQPTTLVSYQCDLTLIFDATDSRFLSEYGFTLEQLAADNWRLEMKKFGMAPTQRLAEHFLADGFIGMRVRSFAKGTSEDDHNMVLWKWGDTLPTRISVVDDEGRLR